MKELSLHILDVVENGLAAGASRIRMVVREERRENRLEIEIEDNGRGIPPEMLANVTDPFVTTRTTRRVGLGLALLKAAALRCNGTFHIDSEPQKGTRVSALFEFDHIDRAPVGDMPATFTTLLAGHPGVDFDYLHVIDGNEFRVDTEELRNDLDPGALSDPRMMFHLETAIRDRLKDLEAGDSQQANGNGQEENSHGQIDD